MKYRYERGRRIYFVCLCLSSLVVLHHHIIVVAVQVDLLALAAAMSVVLSELTANLLPQNVQVGIFLSPLDDQMTAEQMGAGHVLIDALSLLLGHKVQESKTTMTSVHLLRDTNRLELTKRAIVVQTEIKR